MAQVRMHLATPAAPCKGRIVATRRCTASSKSAGIIRHIEIDVSGTPLQGAFRAGQSFGVIPPGVDGRGVPHKVRLYSLASPTRGEDGEGRIVATTVKRTIDEHDQTHKLFLGVASNYLCDLDVGDEVTLTGPSGKRFVLPEQPAHHDFVFFATGTGIAPFRGMLLELLRSNYRGRIALVLGSPYSTDIPYHQELTGLAEQHPNFTYITAVSREKLHDGSPGPYVQDRLKSHAAALLPILQDSRTLVYLCGIAGMELGILRALWKEMPAESRGQYLTVDESASDPERWERRMIHKEVRPTRRVFMEVY